MATKAIIVVIIVTLANLVEGVTLTFENNNQRLYFHCHSNDSNDHVFFGPITMLPFTALSTTLVTSSSVMCTFSMVGKRLTTVDIYEGEEEFEKNICKCDEGVCLWHVLDNGFWCNSTFIKQWNWNVLSKLRYFFFARWQVLHHANLSFSLKHERKWFFFTCLMAFFIREFGTNWE